MTGRKPQSNKLAWVAWAAVCVFWGTTLPAIRVAVRYIPPVLLSGFRFFLAGALLLLLLKIARVPIPKRQRDWLDLASAGFLLALANATLNIAARHITSGPGTLLTVTAALWMVALETLRPGGDAMTPSVAGGLGLGFAGAVVLFVHSGPSSDETPAWAYGLMMLSTFAWGLSMVYLRHCRLKIHTLMSSAWQMLFAAAFLVPAGLLVGEKPGWPWGREGLAAFAYLILFGSLVGFVAYVYMLERLPAAVVGTYTYVNPLVAVWVGWFFLGESVGSEFWLAGALVLAGVYMVNRRPAKPRGEPAASPERA